MVTPVILPKFSMTMEQGTIVRWLKRPGDAVRQGEPIAEVTTEKVNMEIEAPASGVLLDIRAQVGEAIPVTKIIAYIGAAGEATPAADRAPAPRAVDAAPLAPAASPAQAGAVAATPVARRIAREAGLDLAGLRGTGPAGRITEADVRAALEIAAPSPADVPTRAVGAADAVSPLAGRRRVIAQRMAQSAREIPHIYLTREIEMSATRSARGTASYTAVMVWAAGRVLRAHPELRASLDGETVVVHDAVHVGVAADTPTGLIVPVVRDADRKELHMIDEEITALARRAREDTLGLDDVSGATFTVSNLGMWGVDEFTALINPPQAAILAIGAVRLRPWVVGGDALAVRPVCRVTLAVDHRIADGAAGARFLDEFSRRLAAITA